MKILTKDKDISELVETLTWSGDTKNVSRKVEFSYVKSNGDNDFPLVNIEEGSDLYLKDESENVIFGGKIFDLDKTASSKMIKCLAYDLMFYVNNSELTEDYNGTPEQITVSVASGLGIETGNVAVTGISIRNPCIKKTGYQIIQSSYTAAARQNGKKYMPMMTDITKLSVIEKGAESGVFLKSGANITEANFKVSLQKMVNRVLITDKNGTVINVVEDVASKEKYGTIQKIIEAKDDMDPVAEAQNMLMNSDASASVSGYPDDPRAISGYSILLEEPETGLIGKFYIESDTHTYSNGSGTMSLTLAFENMMDEQEPGKPEQKG